ncbi:MAG: methyltransferase domain-containing protein [Anaerolineae bacterium]
MGLTTVEEQRSVTLERRPTQYYVHTIPGIEGIARDELESTIEGFELEGFKTVPARNGMVLFSTPADARDLLRLRVAEDVFVVLARLPEIPWGHEGLDVMQRGLSTSLALNHGLNVLRGIRSLPADRAVTFRTIVRIVTQNQPYQRSDVSQAISRAVRSRSRQQWKAVQSGEQVEVWANLLGRELVVGLRLSDETMRHRAYQKVHLPATLRPSVAAAMVRLTEPGDTDVFLDPMCGTGTILIERGLAGRHGLLVGGDIDGASLAAAAENVGPSHKPRQLMHWDARQLPLADGSVDRVASNLPFGKQLGQPRELPALYREMAAELDRVLRPGGRAVLLTSEIILLRNVVQERPALSLGRRYPINILGQNATMQVVDRRR